MQRQTRREFLKIAGLATAALGDLSIQSKVFGDPKHCSYRETHAGEMDKWLNRTGWPA
ncbi:MAG: twin-arginine translocation signal domain-containing protein [Planctomycetota bacterium]